MENLWWLFLSLACFMDSNVFEILFTDQFYLKIHSCQSQQQKTEFQFREMSDEHGTQLSNKFLFLSGEQEKLWTNFLYITCSLCKVWLYLKNLHFYKNSVKATYQKSKSFNLKPCIRMYIFWKMSGASNMIKNMVKIWMYPFVMCFRFLLRNEKWG